MFSVLKYNKLNKRRGVQKRTSIYFLLGITIITAVASVMALYTAFSYYTTKHQIEKDLKVAAKSSIVALEKNVTDFILSYAIHEYDKLVKNELERRNSFAIIVEDYLMGELMGKAAYISGKIRNEKWEIINFDSNNQKYQQKLKDNFFSLKHTISDQLGKKLGTITIYVSDMDMKRQLSEILIKNFINALAISFLLILTLFLSIHFSLLKPLEKMIDTISLQDEDGIPVGEVTGEGPREIFTLSSTINTMLNTIKTSRKILKNKQEELKHEKDRFKLAVDGTLDGLWDWNLKTDKVYRSPRFETMLGYEVGELPDSIDCWIELLHPDDKAVAQQQVEDYLDTKGDGVYESTFRMRKKNGEWRWITGRGKVLCDDNNNPIRFVGFNTDVTKLIRQQEELLDQKEILQYQASHDELTGLANRVLFVDRLEQGIEKARRNKDKMALLFIDLDHFKEINDSLGHKMGDKILNAVTRRLQKAIRAEDTLARFGGDEFTILIEGLKNEQDASLLAEKILDALVKSFIIDEHELYIGSSIGISIYPDNGKNTSDLLKNADAAMYKAKSEGRNNFQYYSDEMTTFAFERLHLENSLRAAIKNEEFIVYYQPQIDGDTQHLVGIEALVRWQSPSMGLVSPAKFIPLAESTGLIVQLDRLVISKAIEQFVNWHSKGLKPIRLSLNISMKQLRHKDFIAFMVNCLSTYSCHAEWIELEITEGHIMEDPIIAMDILDAISDIGIKLALDDFGTGYSSLSYLKKLPINKLKIDQSFIKGLPYDQEDSAITKAIIALAKNLDLDLIAEGTESQKQIDFLKQNGCKKFQGYYYSRPLSSSDMEVFLSRNSGKNITQLFS